MHDFWRIHWKDACNSPGWAESRGLDLEDVFTVGAIVSETDTKVVMAQSVGKEEEDIVGGLWVIPKSCIVKRKRLK